MARRALLTFDRAVPASYDAGHSRQPEHRRMDLRVCSWLARRLPNAVDQVPTLVGSVLRVVNHSGATYSLIFVKAALEWVHQGATLAVLTVGRSLPVYPDERTFSGEVGMSQRCQQETSRGLATRQYRA